MKRLWIAVLGLACLPLVGVAQDTRLDRMDTTEEGRVWQAVGRLDIGGAGFCTGAMIAPDLVLTAAHCLYEKRTGRRIAPESIEFLAGWRNGRASADRQVRRAVIHPDYVFDAAVSPERVRNDVALLELQRPIRNTTVFPFRTASRPGMGERVGVVSYARGREDAPSLQEVCSVMARQQGMLVMSCNVDFGSSGAPVFSFENGEPRIVSVVSAKAEVDGTKVSLGAVVDEPLALLRERLAAGDGYSVPPAPSSTRIVVGGARRDTGAKFVRP